MGRDKAAKLEALLNEAWDEEEAQGVNCSNADRAAKPSSCLCAVTAGIKGAHLGQAGEQTLGRRIGSPPQCLDIYIALQLFYLGGTRRR